MGSRLGRRVVHFANLPIKVLMPSPPFDCIREFALKTIPSASKIEIRRVLESLYGFQIDDVRTLNMEGKKKKRGGFLAAKPDYKKAYITLKTPLSISPDLFPVPWVQEAMQKKLGGKKAKAKKPSVEEGEPSQQQKHWLDDDRRRREEDEEQGRRRGDKRRDFGGDGGKRSEARWKGNEKTEGEGESRFPWSSMRSWRKEKR